MFTALRTVRRLVIVMVTSDYIIHTELVPGSERDTHDSPPPALDTDEESIVWENDHGGSSSVQPWFRHTISTIHTA